MSDNTGPYKRDGETVDVVDDRLEDGFDDADVDDDAPLHHDPEWLYTQYWLLGRNTEEMAELAGVTGTTICRNMEKRGVPRRDRGEWVSRGHGTSQLIRDGDWLRSQYIDEKKSVAQIAAEQDTPCSTVYYALRREGVELRDYGEAGQLRVAEESTSKQYRDRQWLHQQYWVLGLSASDIASKADCSVCTVYRALDDLGIRTRSYKASNLQRVKREKGTRPDQPRKLVTSDGIDASWRDLKDRQSSEYVQYRDPKWLREQVDAGLTHREIAENCENDVHQVTISKWIRRFGIGDNGGDE